MNVLVISLEFPPDPGGMGEYGYQTARHLTNHGNNVTAIVACKDLKKKDYENFRKKQTFHIEWLEHYNGKTSFLLKHFLFFKNICVSNKINVIISSSPNAGIIAFLIKTLYKIPYIMIGHGSEFLPLNFIRNHLIHMYYSNCLFILANSNFTKKLIDKAKINNTVEILFPGADDSLFDLSKYPKLKTDKNILLSVGALSKRKGHSFVIEAIKKARFNLKNFEYWIIGQGQEKSKLEELVEQGDLKDIIKILGYVRREELPEYYSKAKVFILNSTKLDKSQVEGFGIVLIEAQLMKVAVIGVKDTGMEDAIDQGKTGLLIDSTNINQVAETLISLFNNPAHIEELAEYGYQKAKNQFTWEKFGFNLNKLLISYLQ